MPETPTTKDRIHTLSNDGLLSLHEQVHAAARDTEKTSPTVSDVHRPANIGQDGSKSPRLSLSQLKRVHRLVVAEMTARGMRHMEKIYAEDGGDVPDSVPKNKRRMFAQIWNAAYARYKSEETAFKVAWAAIKKESDMSEVAKRGRRHSKADVDLIDKIIGMLQELRGQDNEQEDEAEEGTEATEVAESKSQESADPKTEGSETPQASAEVTEKRNVRPEVGGGTDVDELRASDFVFSDTRTFPIVTSGDVSDAVHSWGRYKGPHSFDEFKSRLTALCRRKGFTGALPKEWGVKKEWSVEIGKADQSKHLVYGIVLKPAPFVDSQYDTVSKEEIEAAAHRFMERYRSYDRQHEEDLGKDQAVPVESYVAPQELKWGEKLVPEGSWVLVTHIPDDDVWKDVEGGKINAYSIRGIGLRREVTDG